MTATAHQLVTDALDLLRQAHRLFPDDLTAEQQSAWEQTLVCRSEVRNLKLQLEALPRF